MEVSSRWEEVESSCGSGEQVLEPVGIDGEQVGRNWGAGMEQVGDIGRRWDRVRQVESR